MISKYEVVSKLDHSFYIVWVMLFEKEKKFGFDSSLIVVFFLVLYQLDCDKLLVFVIKALDYLSECTFSNDFNKLESVCNMITFLHPIVPLFIIKTIIDKSFELCWFNFILIFSQVKDLFILVNLCPLEVCKVLSSNLFTFGSIGVNREFNSLVNSIVHS